MSYHLSHSQKQVLQSLMTSLSEGKNLLTLSGESGVGKSFLMECFAHQLGEDNRVIKVSYRHETEFFQLIAEEVDIEFSNESSIEDKQAWLIRFFRSQPEKRIIIQVDCLQDMTAECLWALADWVKLISADKNQSPSIHIVLLSVSFAAELFESEKDVIQFFHLKPLTIDTIGKYIEAYLKQLGKDENIFEQSAIDRIIYYSEGIPRLVNQLCDLGLVIAELENIFAISAAVIDEVANDCLMTRQHDFIQVRKEAEQAELITQPRIAFEKTERSYHKMEKEPDVSLRKTVLVSIRKYFFYGLVIGLLLGVGSGVFLSKSTLLRRDGYHRYLRPNDGNVFESKLKREKNVASLQATHSGTQTIENVKGGIKKIAKIRSTSQGEESIQSAELKNLPVDSEPVNTNEKITELIIKAKEQFRLKQLVTPVGDSAWETYKEILRLDDNNKQAHAGIYTISKTYINWAWVEIQKQNHQHAQILFNKALLVSPKDEDALGGLKWLAENELE